MAEKIGAGGKWQEYDTGDGQYGKDVKNKSYSEMKGALRDAINVYSDEPEKDQATFGITKTPKAYKFNRRDTKHHIDHAKEMGYKHQKEYEAAAIEFWNNGNGETYKGSRRGDYAKYNPNTQEYMVCYSDGTIKTYFKIKPRDFERKVKQEGYEKNG